MGTSVLAELASLKTATTAELTARWRHLNGTDPPPWNRAWLVSRLAYRIQELALGGLKPETVRRLDRLVDDLERGAVLKRGRRGEERPLTGTTLAREWRGVEHRVTVTAIRFEWEGRPYKSLSAVARGITGVRWSGWTYFGLKRGGGAT